jgi:hypothetical protein
MLHADFDLVRSAVIHAAEGTPVSIPDLPTPEFTNAVLKQYNDVLYRENNLSIFFDDLTHQHNELLSEMKLIRPKFNALKNTVFIKPDEEQKLIQRSTLVIASEKQRHSPEQRFGETRDQPASPCAETFNAMYSNITQANPEVGNNVLHFKATQAMHTSIIELLGKCLGSLDYMADLAGGHRR